MDDYIQNNIKEIRKKKDFHKIMSNIYYRYNKWIIMVSMFLSCIIGSTGGINIIDNHIVDRYNIINIIMILSTFISVFSKYFDFGKLSNRHNEYHLKYVHLLRNIENEFYNKNNDIVIKLIKDGMNELIDNEPIIHENYIKNYDYDQIYKSDHNHNNNINQLNNNSDNYDFIIEV